MPNCPASLLRSCNNRRARLWEIRETSTDQTLEEVSKQFDVTHERILEIEAKALRKTPGEAYHSRQN